MRQTKTHLSRNLVLSALLTLALLPARGLSQDATAAAVECKSPPCVAIDRLRPGQTHIGRANIQNIVDENAAKTIKKNKEKGEDKTPLQTFQTKMDTGDRLPVIKAPDGTFILLDGHHRTTSFWSIYDDATAQWDQGNHKPDEKRPVVPQIRVTVNEDFSPDSPAMKGKSSKERWKEFSNWMVDNHKVYFDQEILKAARKRRGVPLDTPADSVFIKQNAVFLCQNYLPKDFKALLDSPMRSVVGTVLYNLNNLWDAQQDKAGIKKSDRKSLDGSNQVEYLEFLIGDRLKKKGIEADIKGYLESQKIDPPALRGNEYNPGVLRIIENAIFDNQEEHDFLSDSCRRQPAKAPEVPKCTETDRTAVESAVVALTAIHNTKRATSPVSAPPQLVNPPNVPIQRQVEAAPVQ